MASYLHCHHKKSNEILRPYLRINTQMKSHCLFQACTIIKLNRGLTFHHDYKNVQMLGNHLMWIYIYIYIYRKYNIPVVFSHIFENV